MSKFNFLAQFVAFVQGDEAKVRAIKVKRAAEGGLKTQIAVFEADLQRKEDVVEQALEDLNLARLNNGELISDRDDYVRNLITAHNDVAEAEEDLEAHKATLEVLRNELALFTAEEEAPAAEA